MSSLRPRRMSRPSRPAVRMTSYLTSSHLPGTRPLDASPPLDRATILSQVKSSRRTPYILNSASWASTVTAESLLITMPIPPSVNHQYATVNGRRLLSSAGRAYKLHVGQQVWIVLVESGCRTALLECLHSNPLALSIRFFFTSALRRDVDGGLKIAQDALCEGLGLNDNRIVETHLYKDIDKLNPRIEVSLSAAH